MATESRAGNANNPLNVRNRLAEFRKLQDGWADGLQHAGDWGSGYGKALSHAGLDWLADTFEQCYPADIPLPYTYPTPEGGVQMEWSLEHYEVSLEIDLAQHIAEWHCTDMCSDRYFARDLDLTTSESWTWIAGEILRLEPAGQ